MLKHILTTLTLVVATLSNGAAAQTAAHVDNLLQPVLVADQPWEGVVVYEPTVILGSDGVYRMWYGAGNGRGIGFATSTDGLHFTKYAGNPIIGHGALGLAKVGHSNVAFDGTTYYVYFSVAGASGYGLYVCASPDGVTLSAPKFLLKLPSWAIAFGNTFVLKDGAAYWLVVEAQGQDHVWRTGPAKGISYTGPFAYVMAGSLSLTWGPSLSLGSSYGGPWLARDETTGLYHIWYHGARSGDYPTDIWHATAPTLTDQQGWTRDPVPLLTHTGAGWAADQVADPTLVTGPDGRFWMYYDGLNWAGQESAAIGVAVLH